MGGPKGWGPKKKVANVEIYVIFEVFAFCGGRTKTDFKDRASLTPLTSSPILRPRPSSELVFEALQSTTLIPARSATSRWFGCIALLRAPQPYVRVSPSEHTSLKNRSYAYDSTFFFGELTFGLYTCHLSVVDSART